MLLLSEGRAAKVWEVPYSVMPFISPFPSRNTLSPLSSLTFYFFYSSIILMSHCNALSCFQKVEDRYTSRMSLKVTTIPLVTDCHTNFNKRNYNLTSVYLASYCYMLMTNGMHNSYTQFFIPQFFAYSTYFE